MPDLDARLDSLFPYVLSVFRVVLGLLFTLRGTVKLFDWPIPFALDAPIGSFPFWWAGVIELVAGVLILLGFVTRFAAFIASGQMAVAYVQQHQPKSMWPVENQGELAIVFCFGFLLLVFAGGGAWALDTARGKR